MIILHYLFLNYYFPVDQNIPLCCLIPNFNLSLLNNIFSLGTFKNRSTSVYSECVISINERVLS